MTPVTFWLDYTPRSHVLVGDFGPDGKYEDFRKRILSPVKDYRYHPRLKVGKGWLVDKEKVSTLVDSLVEESISFSFEVTPLEKRGRIPSPKKEPRVNWSQLILETCEEPYDFNQLFLELLRKDHHVDGSRKYIRKLVRRLMKRDQLSVDDQGRFRTAEWLKRLSFPESPKGRSPSSPVEAF